jgi:hypothetical protein
MKKLTWLLIAIIGFINAKAQFLEPVTIKSYPQNTSLISAQALDLNDDGLKEIISITSEHFIVFNHTGDFEFTPDTVYSFAGSEVLDMKMIDIDLDGNMDFIVSTDNATLRKFTHSESGITDEGALDISGGNFNGYMEFGFIDEDEYPDLAVRSDIGISLYQNSGSGGFEFMDGAAVVVGDLALGDLNGDGLDDLCTASVDELLIYKNEGGYSFSNSVAAFNSSFDIADGSTVYKYQASQMEKPNIEIRDLNNDGDSDVFFSVSAYGKLIDYSDTFGPGYERRAITGYELIVDQPSLFPAPGSFDQEGRMHTLLNEYFYYSIISEPKIPERYFATIHDVYGSSEPEDVLIVPGEIHIEGIPQPFKIDDLYGEVFFEDLDSSGEDELILISSDGTSGIFKEFTAFTLETDAMDHFVQLGTDPFKPVKLESLNINGNRVSAIIEKSSLKNRIRLLNFENYPDASQTAITRLRKEDRIESLRSIDFDGDGLDDLIYIGRDAFGSSNYNVSVFVLKQTSSGFTGPFTVIPQFTTGTSSKILLDVADLNSDDAADIVFCFCQANFPPNSFDCKTQVYLNDNGFSNTPDFQIETINIPDFLAIDNFQGDEEPEILIGFRDNDNIGANYEEIGIYSYELEEITDISGQFSYNQVLAEDYNHDGISDIYVTTRAGDAGVLLGTESNEYESPLYFKETEGEYFRFANLLAGDELQLMNRSDVFSIEDDNAELYQMWNNDSIDSFITSPLISEEYEDVVAITGGKSSVKLWRNINSAESEISILVFEDENGDGIRSADEGGISFISVSYQNEVADQMGMAFTNNDGEVFIDVIAADTLTLEVNYNSDIWELTTANSPLSISAVSPPSVVEFGLQSTGSGIWDPMVSQNSKTGSSAFAKSDANTFTLTEENGLTPENFVYIDNDYRYTWCYINGTGETLSTISIENEIPDQLNWQSFAPIASSHNSNTVISSTQGYTILEVEHDGIALEDESAGEEVSTLLFTYTIAAKSDEEHRQDVNNDAVLHLDEDNEIPSNITENKVYTCEGLEEVMSLSVLEQCSPGAIGYTAVEDELETEYTVSYIGSSIPFEELEIYDQSGDTIVFGFTAYVGEGNTELTATNIFGCENTINEVFEIDTIAELSIGTLLETPECFEEYDIFGISDVDVSYGWIYESFGGGIFEFVTINDTLHVSQSGIYHAYPATILPACRDTATLVVEGVYAGYDDGYIDIYGFFENQLRCYGTLGGTYAWYLNDELIPDETNVTIEVELPGWYTCERTFGDCSYFTDPFLWNPLNADDQDAVNINVYPVPADENLFIDLGTFASSGATISLYDMLGKMHTIIPAQAVNGLVELEVSSLAAGAYILNIRDEEGNVAKKKIVVKH